MHDMRRSVERGSDADHDVTLRGSSGKHYLRLSAWPRAADKGIMENVAFSEAASVASGYISCS
jgi:hypothetical protein